MCFLWSCDGLSVSDNLELRTLVKRKIEATLLNSLQICREELGGRIPPALPGHLGAVRLEGLP